MKRVEYSDCPPPLAGLLKVNIKCRVCGRIDDGAVLVGEKCNFTAKEILGKNVIVYHGCWGACK